MQCLGSTAKLPGFQPGALPLLTGDEWLHLPCLSFPISKVGTVVKFTGLRVDPCRRSITAGCYHYPRAGGDAPRACLPRQALQIPKTPKRGPLLSNAFFFC